MSAALEFEYPPESGKRYRYADGNKRGIFIGMTKADQARQFEDWCAKGLIVTVGEASAPPPEDQTAKVDEPPPQEPGMIDTDDPGQMRRHWEKAKPSDLNLKTLVRYACRAGTEWDWARALMDQWKAAGFKVQGAHRVEHHSGLSANVLRECAEKYRALAVDVTRIDGKAAFEKDWSTEPAVPERFKDGENIGILLGPKHGGLIRLDPESPQAAYWVAEVFGDLPCAIYSRPSAPGIGRLVLSPGCNHEQYRLPKECKGDVRFADLSKHGPLIAELKAKGQTMAPPSVHPDTRERLTWDRWPKPLASIEPADAKRRMGLACLLTVAEICYPEPGGRSQYMLALCGVLTRAGLPQEQVAHWVQSLGDKVGDSGKGGRWTISEEDTANKLAAGEGVYGVPALVKFMELPEACEKTFHGWLQMASQTTPAVTGTWPGGLNQFKNIMPNLRNAREAVLRLEVDCKYNEFTNRQIVHGHEIVGGDLTDDSVRTIRMVIADRFGFELTKADLEDAINYLCHQHTFHPVLDSFAALPAWDGVKRIDTWLIDYFGAADTELVRAYSRKVMCALIRRIKEPGCKFDHVLTLTGKQDIGKTLFCTDLAGDADYYADVGILADNSREAAEQFAGKWVIEIGELAGYNNHALQKIKAYITKGFDRARGVWQHYAKDYHRACIFIATVNPGGFLNDPTGERRWWIVEVQFYKREEFLRNRDQLLAEALTAEPGEKLWLETQELKDAQAGSASEYKEPNELVDVLEHLPCHLVFSTKAQQMQQRVSNEEVRRFLDLEVKDLVKGGTRNLSAVIANAMAHLGFHKGAKPMTIESGKPVARGYWRPFDPAKLAASDDATALVEGPPEPEPEIPGLAPPDEVQDYGTDCLEAPLVAN